MTYQRHFFGVFIYSEAVGADNYSIYDRFELYHIIFALYHNGLFQTENIYSSSNALGKHLYYCFLDKY